MKNYKIEEPFAYKLIHIICIFLLTLPQISKSNSEPQLPLAHNYSVCREQFYNCKNDLFNISYPFWGNGRPSYCGGGEFFKLNCFIDKRKHGNTTILFGTTTILLGSQNYIVRLIDVKTYSLKLKRTDQSYCHPQFIDNYLSPSIFQFPTRTHNISIFYNCSSDVLSFANNYQSLCGSQNSAICLDDAKGKILEQTPELKGCGRHRMQADFTFVPNTNFGVIGSDDLEQILDEGFQVKYIVNEECIKCLGSEGYCWNNTSGLDNYQSCYYIYTSDDGPDSTNTHSVHKGTNLWSWHWKLKIILGSAGAALVGLSICIIIFCFKYKSRKNDKEIEAFLKTHDALSVRRYKFSHIKKMTNNFKVKLGEGGYGSVYKGTLLNGCPVAVKILKTSKGTGEEFMNEVSSITKTSHVNVVTLLGFCFEGRKKGLIYELMSNGSLDKFIYNKGSETIPSLSWEVLFQIAKGIARGLEYLHRGCSTRILHFDIKPHNILLDDNFCPKISDFGLARLCLKKESIVSMSEARGTMGYVAPELWNRNFGGVSHKSDVYSFGMMLMEMVGGRKNVNADASQTSEIYFPHWVYKRFDLESDFRAGDVITAEEDEIAKRMTIVGLWCIQTFPNDRPTMSRVIEMLEGNVNSLEIPPKPILSSPTRSLPKSSS